MNHAFWDHISCVVTKEEVLKRMGMPIDHMYGKYIDEMIEASRDIVNPKAVCRVYAVEDKTEDSVTIGGKVFTSKILAEKLKNIDQVYAYLCTCGKEIADFSEAQGDIIKELALDGIMNIYLRKAAIYMTEQLDNLLDGQTACVSPGSFEDWPLVSQHDLFALLGDDVAKTGIELTESGIMYPVKSVSGFRFKVAQDDHDCRLCLKRDCVERSGDFDPECYEAGLC
ncbi:MAG TPA: vitamin B12 dependent-methionine synthase activation domain-containing protein [Clostridiales bacterium]|nr:vitamin B12 dependent-methionine synthase activation domain-containing protein [Clostridiales bacterium]